MYNNQKVCVKTYESTNKNLEDLEIAYKEIRIYQELSKWANSKNCFLKVFGTYIENFTLHVVMDWYEYNLMEKLTYIIFQGLHLSIKYNKIHISRKSIS